MFYPDGFSGERAAIKISIYLMPDFYRDSIRVWRITSRIEQSPEYPDENQTGSVRKTKRFL